MTFTISSQWWNADEDVMLSYSNILSELLHMKNNAQSFTKFRPPKFEKNGKKPLISIWTPQIQILLVQTIVMVFASAEIHVKMVWLALYPLHWLCLLKMVIVQFTTSTLLYFPPGCGDKVTLAEMRRMRVLKGLVRKIFFESRSFLLYVIT